MNVVRGIVILAILTMTVIAADCVFVVTTEHEARNFKQAYKDVSAQLHRKFYDQVENFLWVAKGFSVGIGQSMNMAPWPNATVSNFAAISEAPLHLSNASLLTFSPILSSSSRLPWEAYASATYKSLHDTPQGSIDSDHVTYHDSKRHSSEGIYNFNNGTTSDEESVGPYLFPIWQAFPLLPEDSTSDLIGTLFNEGSHPVREKGLKHMMDRTGSTVTSFLYEDSNLRDLANYDVPRTNLYYPVFHPLTAIPSTAVASIGLQFQWETTLRDAVIDYIETLVVVVENSFEEKYSYAVNGFSAKFLGYGDLHNPKVDGFHVTKSTFDEFSALFDEHGAVKHDPNNLCSYKITVYPSKEFKEKVRRNVLNLVWPRVTV